MISIIICTYNRDKFLADCLKSLTNQTLDTSKFEVIIINNKCTDMSDVIIRDYMNKYSSINWKYFFEDKQGLSYARNRGIAEAKGNVIAFLDDDAIACANYAEYLLEQFQLSDFDAGGGKIIPKWEVEKPKWMNRFLLPLVSVIDLGNKQKQFKRRKYPIGANMFLKRNTIETIGIFNPSLGRIGKSLLGGEEKDIFNRIKNSGQIIGYFPEIWVYHIIPKERTEVGFIKSQALGIGASERIRTIESNVSIIRPLIIEFLKWIATIILSIYYLLLLRSSSSIMLIRFRWWVSKGLLHKHI